MVRTSLILNDPTRQFGKGETLRLGDNVHIVLKSKAYVSGTASGYCADGGYLEYIMLTDGNRRVLVFGKDIKEISVLPMQKEEKYRRKRR